MISSTYTVFTLFEAVCNLYLTCGGGVQYVDFVNPAVPIPKDKNGWPVKLIVPTPNEFIHGEYYHHSDDSFSTSCAPTSEIKRAMKHDCGTKCCLLGWAAIAFEGHPRYYHYENNDAKMQFLATFNRLAGVTPQQWQTPLQAAEAAFEGFSDQKELTPLQAHRLWVQAARAHGYDAEYCE